jgi:predicted metal-dependent phosphotriesterase family hydrolase
MSNLTRRSFLKTNLRLASGYLCGASFSAPYIMTVSSSIPSSALGKALTHEHVLVDFIGADKINKDRYDIEEAFQQALPYLQQLKQRGCTALIECTPSYLGKDVVLLKRLSEASGLHIITNTGYYGAAGQKFLPAHVYNEAAEQIAARWIKENNDGIEGTGIKPGFMKLGADDVPFSKEINKIIKAAAITHLQTGLSIGVHTSKGGKPAMEQLRILRENKVSPEAWIWIHAQNEKDSVYHIEAARLGGWIEFDGISENSIDENIMFLSKMKENKLLHRVLISQDAGWYHVGEPHGGNYRDYNYLFDYFLPALKKHGFTEEDIEMLLIKNPAEAFQIKIRRKK